MAPNRGDAGTEPDGVRGVDGGDCVDTPEEAPGDGVCCTDTDREGRRRRNGRVGEGDAVPSLILGG